MTIKVVLATHNGVTLEHVTPGETLSLINEGGMILIQRTKTLSAAEAKCYASISATSKTASGKTLSIVHIPTEILLEAGIHYDDYIAVKEFTYRKGKVARISKATKKEIANYAKKPHGSIATGYRVNAAGNCRIPGNDLARLGIKQNGIAVMELNLVGSNSYVRLTPNNDEENLASLAQTKKAIGNELFYTARRKCVVEIKEGQLYMPAAWKYKINAKPGDILSVSYGDEESEDAIYIGRPEAVDAVSGNWLAPTDDVVIGRVHLPEKTTMDNFVRKIRSNGGDPKKTVEAAIAKARAARKPGRPTAEYNRNVQVLEDILVEIELAEA